jgi:hypothetical protein
VLEDLGGELPHHQHGDRWTKMDCPFHGGDSGSVNFQANRFHCWAGCTDRPEDAIGLLMLYGGCRDFLTALAEAERIAGPSIAEVRSPRKRGSGLFDKSWNNG